LEAHQACWRAGSQRRRVTYLRHFFLQNSIAILPSFWSSFFCERKCGLGRSKNAVLATQCAFQKIWLFLRTFERNASYGAFHSFLCSLVCLI
jgi:hypothetical protein